ncbi:MAG TPA: type II toxin-antitoxin system RelE/ParE family toxin [Terriglobales bacterium]|nr:type II toxin-antitoxin system RelE/ParE family toxin [Terriglobales bacterium]
MALTLYWTPAAVSHLRSTYEYVAQDNARAAQALIERILSVAERLRDFPRMGPEGRVEDTRELVIAGTPFLVVYRLHRSRVDVLAVFHAARKWPEVF